jgi:hypothetical protein
LRSFLLVVGLLAASTVMWGFLMTRASAHSFSDKPGRALLGAFAYPVMYLSFAVILGRGTPLARLGEPIASRVGFILALVLGTLGSVLLSLASEGRPNGKLVNALNPIVGMVNLIDRSGRELDLAAMAAVTVALVSTVVALVLLAARDGVRR